MSSGSLGVLGALREMAVLDSALRDAEDKTVFPDAMRLLTIS